MDLSKQNIKEGEQNTSPNIAYFEAPIILDPSIDVNKLTEAQKELALNQIEAPPNDISFIDSITKDVTPFSSILMSATWNGNDEVFTSDEIMKAVDTGRYKPINWQHRGSEVRGNEIIGVMIDTYLLEGFVRDEEGDPIENPSLNRIESDDLSDFQGRLDSSIHIRQDGLLWSYFFPTYIKAINEGIENSQLFVSVEVLFADFGYALRKKKGDDIQFINRNKSNENWADKLRINKGPGTIVVNGVMYQIGRWLKDFVISGNGIVHRPANPNSFIIKLNSADHSTDSSQNNINSDNFEKSVYNRESLDNNITSNNEIDKGNSMSDLEKLQTQLNQIMEERDGLSRKVAELQESNSQKIIDELNDKVTKIEEEKEALNSQISELSEKAKKADELTEKFESTSAELEKTKEELAEIRQNEVGRSRLNEAKSLTVNSVKPYTDEDLDTFISMSEDSWNTLKDNLERFIDKSENKDSENAKGKNAKDEDGDKDKDGKMMKDKDGKMSKSETLDNDTVEALNTADVNNDEKNVTSVSSTETQDDIDNRAARTLVGLALSRSKK